MVLVDSAGEYVYMNPDYTAITGYTLEDTLSHSDWLLRSYPDPPEKEGGDGLPERRLRHTPWDQGLQHSVQGPHSKRDRIQKGLSRKTEERSSFSRISRRRQAR
jgi:PAS domain-containing protein